MVGNMGHLLRPLSGELSRCNRRHSRALFLAQFDVSLNIDDSFKIVLRSNYVNDLFLRAVYGMYYYYMCTTDIVIILQYYHMVCYACPMFVP